MWCPFYWGKCMCGVKTTGLYVPSEEVEFKYCVGDYSSCPKLQEINRHAAITKVCHETVVKEEKKKVEPPLE